MTVHRLNLNKRKFAAPKGVVNPAATIPRVEVNNGSRTVSIPRIPVPIEVGQVNSDLAVCVIATGEGGRAIWRISEPSVKAYSNRIGADLVVVTDTTNPEYEGFAEKYRLGTLLDHYERVLYLDADILITKDCPSLFDVIPTGTVGIHDDYPWLTTWKWLTEELETFYASQGWKPFPPDFCFNSGVMIFGQEHRKLFEPPPQPFSNYWCGEQHGISCNIKRYGIPITLLDTKYNCQWWFDKDFALMRTASVLHFAGMENQSPGRGGRLEAMRRWSSILEKGTQ